MNRREYNTYETYLDKQAEKLEIGLPFAQKQSHILEQSLDARLLQLHEALDLPGFGSVLCLGARLGGEVVAFIKHGYFAVGVDINPGENNEHVLFGDFHNLVFADNSIDIAFTNSLDHVFDMDKLLAEVKRVLKPGGFFLTENKAGKEEPDFAGDEYDCMEWATLQSLTDFIVNRGFRCVHTYKGNGSTPWGIAYRKER